ncbi:E3 ubiquitin-protein ligase TRIM33-like [Saccoglossus kowalevskii]|uniref:E3 ubiquitin-protein ligase TRIM33-like n=1 Tax=Saccoglossus kowalevskii TaxID=10224 RepID=A0ABM0N058_SACKO|nr:PREDICTED: E3 ubiquitin-protein ligase TRIM33-like [Saccoglossus kowalevskii]
MGEARSSKADLIGENYLTCCVCFERYQNPKILPCHHSFCELCLTQWVEEHGGHSCPLCRKTFQDIALQELPPSIVISGVIEILEGTNPEKNGPITCNGCQGSRDLTQRCMDCAVYLCKRCVTAHGRNHNIVTIQRERLNVAHCSTHKGKVLDLFCETCVEAVCSLCVPEKHNTHAFSKVETAAANFLYWLDPQIRDLSAKIKEAHNTIDQLTTRGRHVKKKKEEAELQIKEQTEHSIQNALSVIRKQEERLLKNLEREFTEVETKIKKDTERLRSSVDLLKASHEYIDKVKQYSSAVEVMKSRSQVKTTMETMLSLDTKLKNTQIPKFVPTELESEIKVLFQNLKSRRS